MVRLHLTNLAKQLGFDVIAHFSSGEDVVNFMEEQFDNECDIILMDIMLEGNMDGVEAAEIIFKEHHIPIIYMSALSDVETLSRANKIEPFYFIVKPFNEKEVKDTIEACLANAQA